MPDLQGPTFTKPQDDVVYLGTFPRPSRPPSTSSFRHAAGGQDRALNVPDRKAHGEEGKLKTSFAMSKPASEIARREKTKSPRCTTVPMAIRNRNIHLGRARNSAALVYGFFDEAGQFRRREESERDGSTSDMCPYTTFIPISHDQVTYRGALRYMTHRQVRDEVRRRLIAALGTRSHYGEI